MKKKEENKELVVNTPQAKPLVLEGDPQAQLDFAMKAANALMNAVNQKPKKVMILGEQYLEYGDWQTLARFFGATASVAWSKKLIDEKGTFLGYEARAEVLHNGMVISAAEAMCMKTEANWRSRDEFMLRSMAQTRAAAKALRNAYGWVAELAGMKSTPAEEMGGLYDQSPIKDSAIPTVTYDDPEKPKIVPPKIVADAREPMKRQIKDLVDSIVLEPLEHTADAYSNYVFSQTGMLLEPKNYGDIIAELMKIKEGAK